MEYREIKNSLIKGLWFFGLSGSGKTTSSKYIKNNILTKALLLDGDVIRECVSFDLGYSVNDSTTQITRILGMCKICINSNVFPICSSVYMDKKTIDGLYELNIVPIKIERDFDYLKKIKIYNNEKNVLGVDLNYEKDLQCKIIKNIEKKQLHENLKKYIIENNIKID